MNIVLNLVQILLAVKLVSVAYTHGINPDKQEMQDAMQKMGKHARPVLIAISLLCLFAVAGLLLPLAIGNVQWLLPGIGVFVCMLITAALFLHIKYRKKPKTFASIVIFIIAAFIFYGRWMIAPV